MHALRLLCKFPFFQTILREIAQLFPDHTWIYFKAVNKINAGINRRYCCAACES
jgi:hypothetical protein